VDEYQNFASESFAVLQSEARKLAIDLIVAHQFRDQLDEESRGSALNVGNFVSFRIAQRLQDRHRDCQAAAAAAGRKQSQRLLPVADFTRCACSLHTFFKTGWYNQGIT